MRDRSEEMDDTAVERTMPEEGAPRTSAADDDSTVTTQMGEDPGTLEAERD